MNIHVKCLRGFINQGLERFFMGWDLTACVCFGVQESKSRASTEMQEKIGAKYESNQKCSKRCV